jgi:hypothetical protein
VEGAGNIRGTCSKEMHECTLPRCFIVNANYMDGFVCSIMEGSQGQSLWRGRAEHVPIQTAYQELCIKVLEGGKKINVLKRFTLLKQVGLKTMQ